MTDYAELVKNLRDDNVCLSVRTAHDAADAIEQLSTYSDFYEELTDKGIKTIRELLDKFPTWIPVTERLPDTCAPVLVCLRWGMDDYEITVGEYWGNSKASPGWGIFDPYVTHWMPLPDPPKEET